MMLLEGVQKWTNYAEDNTKFTEILYHLCRHGNFSFTEAILTEEELELTCISPKFEYVSSDSHLESAAFINLIFIKILVFHILLSPSKMSSSDSTIKANMEIISSIFY